MNGREFIEGVAQKIRTTTGESGTDKQIADYLGITLQTLYNWKSRENIKVGQMVGLLDKVQTRAIRETEKNAIQPIVEFFEVACVESRQQARYEIFGVSNGQNEPHPYLEGLQAELKKHRGIYIFYDSRGRALYAGKARQQTLWAEMNNVFNRPRRVQKIYRVNHPERRKDFRTSDEIQRQIVNRQVPLYMLAAYFSAYKVADGLVADLEALLIRGFANDLLNVRMEKFS